MDRKILYPAQIPLVEDALDAQRYAMVGIGHLAGAAFGANTVAASGLACAPGGGLALTIAPGALLAPGVVDVSAYGTLAAVSSAIVRQFISRDPATLVAPAAGATYIVSASPQTVDTDDAVLPFYNAADPSVTYAGEGNSGLAAPTVRRDEVTLSIGTSVPDGAYPLWQISVPAGATEITAKMISVASGAPFYPSLVTVASRIVAPFNAQLAVAMGGYPLNAVVADSEIPGSFWVSKAGANVSTPGASGGAWQSLFDGYATVPELQNEATTRANADDTIQANVTSEATARANADANLQSQIDLKVATISSDDGINSPGIFLAYSKGAETVWVNVPAIGPVFLVKTEPGSGFNKIVNLSTDSSGNLIVPDSSGLTREYSTTSSGKIAANGNLLGGYWVKIGNVLRQVFSYTASYGDFIQFPTEYSESPIVHVTAAAYGGMATTANISGLSAYNGFTFISSVYAGDPNRLENTGANTITVMVEGLVG